MSVLGQISAALMNGDVKRLDQLITKNKLPINVFLETQQTLLQCATANNLPDIVFYLLQKGINIAITEKDTGATPLHTAAQKGFCRILRMLLEHGANPNARDANGGTALHYATQEGQVEACQILIEKNAPLNAKAKFDVTPLHLAASVNQPAVCQVLLDHQANPEMTTTKGMTPLHIACFKNNGVILDILIRNGANPKALTTQSQRSGLHFACINGSLPISLLLARLGVDCMQPDIDGKTPIDLAIEHNHPELPGHLASALQPFFDRLDDRTVVRILCTVAKGTRDFRFLTNMLLVCKRWYSFREPVSRQFCMNSYRCRPNLRIVPQQSLSASASSSSRDKRSAPLPVQLSNSWTRQISVIYRLMSCYGSGQMNAALILAMGASLSSPASINTKPALSFEQLMLLEILRLHKPLNKEASASLAYEPGHCIRTLLEHGTDPNCLIVPSPPPGQPLPTALQVAIHSRNGILRDGQSVKTCDDILQLLYKAGADSNRPDSLEGNSPLHWAAIRGEESSLRILADTLGGNINQKNNAGDTPIILAARHCQWACVGALLERSADLTVTNSANETLAIIVQNHANAAALASSGGAPGPAASGPSDPKKKVEKPLIRIPSEPLRTTLFNALGLTPPASPAPAPVARPRPPAPARQGSVSSLPTPGGEGARPMQRQGSAVLSKNTLLSPKGSPNPNPNSNPPSSPLSSSGGGDPGSPGEVRKAPPRRVSMKPPGQAPLPSSGGSVPDADVTPPSSPLTRSSEPESVAFADSTTSSSSSSSNQAEKVVEETEEIFEYTQDEEEEYRKRVEEEKKYAAAEVLSPLHQAAMECEATTLFTLLEAGSDVNQINKCGSSAVHIAAWFGSLPCMKHLINFNADLNLRNRAGDTAYSLARLRAHKDMLDFFHQHYSVHVDRIRGMYLEPLSKS